MQGSRIYSDFFPDVAWIRREIAKDIRSFTPPDQSLARLYTERRLKIIKGSGTPMVLGQRMGTPVPYAAFWFADALGLNDNRLRRLAGLSLVCSYINATLRDDIVDSRPARNAGRARLAEFWSRRYMHALSEVFSAEQEFLQVTSSADKEWTRYREWQSNPSAGTHPQPFSASFLSESSRYYVSCSLPPLVAIAYAAGREEDATRIEKFLREFAMGCRIVDDLVDWEADLDAKEQNRSSVLTYVRNRMGQAKTVDRIDALSWFLSDEFVEDSYGAMIGFYQKAWKAVAGFGNPYLDLFMKELIDSLTEKRDSLLRHASLTLAELSEGLTQVLGPRRDPRKRGSVL